MINISYLYEFEKQFLKFKISLRTLIRSVVQKGLSRMYKIDLFDLESRDILSEILETNLSEKQFMLIQDLFNNFSDSLNKLVQEFINYEVEEFLKENPEVSKKGEINIRRNTSFGEISLNVPRFRNAEFKSAIITRKSRNFLTETLTLAMIVMNGLMSYEEIKTFFRAKGVSISNNEISRITSIANDYRKNEIEEHITDISSHKLVVFVDGVWNKHKKEEMFINEITGEVFVKKVAKRTVSINAIGIDNKGCKKVLCSVICDSENSDGYRMLLNKLKNQLGINKIDVIVSDGSRSLDDPLLEFYPETKRQRCVTHVLRTIKLLMPKNQRKILIPIIRKIYHCNNKEDTRRYFRDNYEMIYSINSKVAMALKKIIESTLTFYDLPKSLWRSSYTNNISENFNSVFRRFSPSNTCFISLESLSLTLDITSLHMNSKYKNYDLF